MTKIYGKTDGGVINPKPIFAADADTIIFLSKIAFGDIYDLNRDFAGKPMLLKTLNTLWKHVYYGQMELVITPSVIAELGLSDSAKQQYNETMLNRDLGEIPLSVAKFVRHFCTPLLEPNDKNFEQKIIQLAEEYCLNAGFNYLYENGVVKPCKDAFNLAQAVYFGLPFLTGNTSDYIEDVKGRNGSVIHRLEKIHEINTKLGYVKENERYPYNISAPVSIWHLFPEYFNVLPSESFMEDFHAGVLVKDISVDDVMEEGRDYFKSNIDKLEVLEHYDYSSEVPQTMLVLVDSERSTPTCVEPSFIAFISKRSKRDNPYIYERLNADILYYISQDADENSEIQLDDYYKSVTVPRDVRGNMRKTTHEYKEYARLLEIYKKRYASYETNDGNETEQSLDEVKED